MYVWKGTNFLQSIWKICWGKQSGFPASGKGKPICEISFAQAVVTICPSLHWVPCGTWHCHYTFGDLNWFLFDCHIKVTVKITQINEKLTLTKQDKPTGANFAFNFPHHTPLHWDMVFYMNKNLVVSQNRIRKASHTSTESTLERSGTHRGVHLLLNLDRVCTTKIKCTSSNWPCYIPYSPFWEGKWHGLGSGRKRWHTEGLPFSYLGAFFSCKSPSFLYNFVINIVAVSVHFLIPLLFPGNFSYLTLRSLPFVSLTRGGRGEGEGGRET